LGGGWIFFILFLLSVCGVVWGFAVFEQRGGVFCGVILFWVFFFFFVWCVCLVFSPGWVLFVGGGFVFLCGFVFRVGLGYFFFLFLLVFCWGRCV